MRILILFIKAFEYPNIPGSDSISIFVFFPLT